MICRISFRNERETGIGDPQFKNDDGGNRHRALGDILLCGLGAL